MQVKTALFRTICMTKVSQVLNNTLNWNVTLLHGKNYIRKYMCKTIIV